MSEPIRRQTNRGMRASPDSSAAPTWPVAGNENPYGRDARTEEAINRTALSPKIKAHIGETLANSRGDITATTHLGEPQRRHYSNVIARAYAERGYSDFAQIVEAGHGCAACHLTHYLNRIPTDTELDMERYDRISVLMRSLRDGAELGSSTFIGAVTRLRVLFAGPAKVSLINPSGGLDQYLTREFGRIVAENPVAYRSYQQLVRHGTSVILDFSPNPLVRDAGLAFPHLNEVVIFMANNVTAKEAASSLAHEAQHMQRFWRGLRINTQIDEYRSALREHLFSRGSRPTAVERVAIRKAVNERYAHLPKGD